MSWDEEYDIGSVDTCRSAAVALVETAGGDIRALVDVLDTLGLRERLGYDPH